MSIQSQIDDSVKCVREILGTNRPHLGIVLGSGLGSVADLVENPKRIAYREIPHFVQSSVQGHAGQLLLGTIAQTPVVIMQGRLHAYEGLTPAQVIHPIRVMAALGIQSCLLTNAAGGLSAKMRPGDFMIIEDHINLTGMNPLVGPNFDKGPRFVDMTEVYDSKLSKLLAKSMVQGKCKVHRGTYVGVMGPTYETAAEIKFFAKIGGGAVGMSTVFEAIALRHLGIATTAVSCITNLGTGLSKKKLDHDDVKAVATKVETKLAKSVAAFVKSLN